jgi:multidrug efflux system membrane fusion protein
MLCRRRENRPWPSLVACVTLLAGMACAKPPAKPQRAPISVAVVPVRLASLPYTIDANGTVTPLQTAAVSAQVDGLIQAVLFEEGREVTAGQVLFRIDSRPYQAAFQAAHAALDRDSVTMTNLMIDADRYQKLAKSQVVTQQELDAHVSAAAAARATVQADSAQLANAKFALDNTTIRAPISGRTGGLLVRAGNLVRANGGTPLVVINQVRPIQVRFSVPGGQLPMLLHYYNGAAGGLPVTVSSSSNSAPAPQAPGAPVPPDASPSTSPPTRPVVLSGTLDDPPVEGKLFFIDNAVDTTTGTVQLKAKFDNKSGTLWAGQFVSASLRLFVEDSALVVPAQCVVTGQRGTYVFVIDSANIAQQRPVTVERAANGLAVIASGVRQGERVVTDGQSRLTQGAAVDLRTGRDSAGGGGRGGRGGGRKGGTKAP